MKKILNFALFISIATLFSCYEFTPGTYSSTQDFFSKNNIQMQTYTINGTTGGSFTSPQGTVVTIPTNAFITQSNVPVTGDVTIQFKDVYKKSDMLLSDMGTSIGIGGPLLLSGGEFFIKATFNNEALLIAPGKSITVNQPKMLTDNLADTANQMMPFIANQDSAGPGWQPNTSSYTVNPTLSDYVFSLYSFNTPVDSGSWCNSDNPYYFAVYPQTTLTLTANGISNANDIEVFLLFTGLSSMVHVYSNGTPTYAYSYAPQGLHCTMVAVGVADGQLSSCFLPITIGSNETYSFSLSPTNTVDFKAHLNTLN